MSDALRSGTPRTDKLVNDHSESSWGNLVELARQLELEISQQSAREQALVEALKLVSVLIWRDKEMNACGLEPGDSGFVHAIEKALAPYEEKKNTGAQHHLYDHCAESIEPHDRKET